MTARLGRRSFLQRTGVAAAATALPFSMPLRKAHAASPYGELVADPNGIMDLPAGFTYTILGDVGGITGGGQPMDDGLKEPGLPDGMAVFTLPSGDWALMRNHEVSSFDPLNGPWGFGGAPPEAYDSAGGCVTRLVIDPNTLEVKRKNVVLGGTIRNCAGGWSPWGWISCEEDESANHGYAFLCNVNAETIQPAVRLDGLGRMNHEAAAVDARTSIIYLTEDKGDSALYRYVPADPNDPFAAGQLQALRNTEAPEFSTSSGMTTVGQTAPCDWVDIDDVTAASASLRNQSRSKGGLSVARGEGIWYHDGQIYFCSTSGGPVGGGQIFRLIDAGDTATLELVAISTDKATLDMPDNITVHPVTGEVFMAEDGGSPDHFVRFIGTDGLVYDFARVRGGELAGVCFSPDGGTMFVNRQVEGQTLAIRGTFPTGGGGTTGTTTGGETTTGDTDPTGGSTSTTGSDTTGGTTGTGSSGGETGTGTTSGGTSAGGSGTGGDTDATDGGSAGAGAEEEDAGCACSTDASGASVTLQAATAAVALVGLRLATRAGDEG